MNGPYGWTVSLGSDVKLVFVPIGSIVSADAAKALTDAGHHLIYYNPQGAVDVFEMAPAGKRT